MSYLLYLCLLTHSGAVLCFSFVFPCLVYPMLPVSLNCPFLIAPSVFSNVYLSFVPCVASFSKLSIFDCPYSCLCLFLLENNFSIFFVTKVYANAKFYTSQDLRWYCSKINRYIFVYTITTQLNRGIISAISLTLRDNVSPQLMKIYFVDFAEGLNGSSLCY